MNNIPVFSDIRGGCLLPINALSEISFHPKRIFSVIDVPVDGVRGEHAHYRTKQLLICVKGEIEVGMYNKESSRVVLLKQGNCVYMDNMTWGYQKFKTGKDFLLVIASTEHDIKDYITDKKEFDKMIGNIP